MITPSLLREWALPEPGASKYGRGQVLAVGGARGTPGAVLLAGLAALRVGAGRLTVAVADSVAAASAVAVPEAGVVGLPEDADGSVTGGGARLSRAVTRADAVLVGSGLDEPEGTVALLSEVLRTVGDDTSVVLDAFALGVLPGMGDAVGPLRGRLVLTPNEAEAARLLGEPDGDVDVERAVPEVAERFGAVVTCRNLVAAPDGRRWQVAAGHSGLGTSGSGDVLAGAVLGLLARGATPEQAACWATHAHAAAGDRLTARVGRLGFLARELVDQLPAVITELGV
ncbi:NAD(P)H-hydrate dehydratase [Nakamurella endophytica]|uniref:NAD(P)H-hydrate dehydratase n=1 Tax=Nakamurella endophytica TaxID=1748367 RepID=UPI001E486BC4|nr:NAD(P)H-hydrate dehydratase [Nakamurella endophytica]